MTCLHTSFVSVLCRRQGQGLAEVLCQSELKELKYVLRGCDVCVCSFTIIVPLVSVLNEQNNKLGGELLHTEAPDSFNPKLHKNDPILLILYLSCPQEEHLYVPFLCDLTPWHFAYGNCTFWLDYMLFGAVLCALNVHFAPCVCVLSQCAGDGLYSSISCFLSSPFLGLWMAQLVYHMVPNGSNMSVSHPLFRCIVQKKYHNRTEAVHWRNYEVIVKSHDKKNTNKKTLTWSKPRTSQANPKWSEFHRRHVYKKHTRSELSVKT